METALAAAGTVSGRQGGGRTMHDEVKGETNKQKNWGVKLDHERQGCLFTGSTWYHEVS